MPQDVSRAGRWGLLVGVIALHAGVAAVVVHSSRQQTVVGEPAPITVALLSEEAHRATAPVPIEMSPRARSATVQPASPAPQTILEQPLVVSTPPRSDDVSVESHAGPPGKPMALPPVAMLGQQGGASASAPTLPEHIEPTSRETASDGPISVPESQVQYARHPHPQFPALSQALGESGEVVLSVLVDERGIPLSATVKKSSGYPRLDEAAKRAVMQAVYLPQVRNGVARQQAATASITFNLRSR
ncbi:MAG: energy transducer TonB [Burkholderiales bacterium]|nr:energy transducer TonB [Burkholderiales bacterium]MDE2432392.1 energy transducer TonB [Burkholderiales bacterium]